MRTQILYIKRTMNYARRSVIGLLLLVLGAGMPVLSAQAGQMAEPVMAISAHQMPLNGCNNCGGGDMAMMTSACSSMGTCVQGVVVRPDLLCGCRVTFPLRTLPSTSLASAVRPNPFPPNLTSSLRAGLAARRG